MATPMENLTAAVTRIQGVVPSATKLITDAAAYIRDHANDPVALQAYADSLDASAGDLAAAVAANPVPVGP